MGMELIPQLDPLLGLDATQCMLKCVNRVQRYPLYDIECFKPQHVSFSDRRCIMMQNVVHLHRCVHPYFNNKKLMA